MKIDELIQREDFYKINENTLRRYFEIVHARHIVIETKGYSLKNYIVVYPYIGSIVTRIPSTKILKYWLNEYSIRGNLIKNIASKIYVLCCFFLLV